MKLRYITLHIDSDSNYQNSFSYSFNDHSRFISNYLSIQVRKLKYETDGTFNMIAISPSKNIKHICRIVGDNALQIRIKFDGESYEQMSEIEKYEYYLHLIEEGYRIASKYKSIPLDELIKMNDEFRNNEYKNEWVHKKKRFKEFGIDVSLDCSFTSQIFQLKLSAMHIKSKAVIVSGIVFTTEPDEVCYQPLFKKLTSDGQHIIITDFLDKPKYMFRVSDILNGIFNCQISKEGFSFKRGNLSDVTMRE